MRVLYLLMVLVPFLVFSGCQSATTPASNSGDDAAASSSGVVTKEDLVGIWTESLTTTSVSSTTVVDFSVTFGSDSTINMLSKTTTTPTSGEATTTLNQSRGTFELTENTLAYHFTEFRNPTSEDDTSTPYHTYIDVDYTVTLCRNGSQLYGFNPLVGLVFESEGSHSGLVGTWTGSYTSGTSVYQYVLSISSDGTGKVDYYSSSTSTSGEPTTTTAVHKSASSDTLIAFDSGDEIPFTLIGDYLALSYIEPAFLTKTN